MNKEIEDFLREWHSARTTLTVHTSGSTGVPKAIEVEKERMRASARMTCRYLNLQQGDTALLCMPLRYIAGMMMVVRSEETGMRLISVEPSSHPLKDLTLAPTFAAMVPSQVYETLKVERERKLFSEIRHVIIGGGALDAALEAELRTLPNHIWHSYGMTETLSHIALRPINEPWFTPLPGITIDKDENNCLVIDAPALNPNRLYTHDIVEFREEAFTPSVLSSPLGGFCQRTKCNGRCHFRIIGRSDNVICSGGIKIQIEEVEACLRPVFGDTIQVTSTPHAKFGEIVVYLTTQPLDEQQLRTTIPNPYWMPKRIIQVDALPRTATGKPDRARAKEMAKNGQNHEKL